MCESMNPGTTNIPRASITRTSEFTRFITSALEPTTASRSPFVSNASAHGRRSSPVQTRALTTASALGPLEVTKWMNSRLQGNPGSMSR